MKKLKIVIIVGPTSSGKSALAVELARKFGGEIISADSRQVYKGLDIGTGKITKREMKGVPHHMLDVASPKRTFTAADYVKLARAAYSNVLKNNRIAIVVGGTGFYIDALVGRIRLPDVPPNTKLRRSLERKSAEELFKLLQKRSPRRAKTIDHYNKRRLIRALEIAEDLCKTSMMEIRPPSFDILWIGLKVPRDKLERKIHVRLLARVKQGLIAEGKHLHASGLSYKRMESLGLEYRALARYLQEKTGKSEMIEQLDSDIRHYAKRQMTYWKRNKDIKWFRPSQVSAIKHIVKKFLEKN